VKVVIPTFLFFIFYKTMSTTYFIDEVSLIFSGIYAGISGLIDDMNLFFMWILLFFGIFLFMSLMTIMIKKFFGDR